MRVEFAVFAHNEEAGIVQALDSIRADLPAECEATIYVLINGSRDRTEEIVCREAQHHSEIVPVVIKLGDKCNAWNVYTHELAGDCDLHWFMDGDVRIGPGSLPRMVAQMQKHTAATTCAGVPLTGRNRRTYIGYIEKLKFVFGNLYCIRNSHLMALRTADIHLPVGLQGDDHFVGMFAAAVPPSFRKQDPSQVVYDLNAGYEFDSLQFYRPRDWRIYFRRYIAYGLRQRQLEKIYDMPPPDLPVTIDDLNQELLAMMRRGRGSWDKLNDWLVVRRLARLYPTPQTRHYSHVLATVGSVPHTIHRNGASRPSHQTVPIA